MNINTKSKFINHPPLDDDKQFWNDLSDSDDDHNHISNMSIEITTLKSNHRKSPDISNTDESSSSADLILQSGHEKYLKNV
jgi:hypothetical protein